jgi:HEAT repeats
VTYPNPPYVNESQVHQKSRQARNVARRSSRYIPAHLARNQHLARYLARYAHNWRIRCLAIKFLGQSSQQKLRSLLLLQNCARQDIHCDVRYLALEALLTGWRHHFMTLVTLLDRVHDQHRDVQYLAVSTLADDWKHHPAARQCLEQIVESNAGWIVKFIAIEALARD